MQVSHSSRSGRAVARRAALDDVGDVNVGPLQAHRLDHLVQQLPGAADEGFALLVFVGAGAFADEHQLSARVADAEHDLLAPVLVQLAAGAVFAKFFADDAQRGGGIVWHSRPRLCRVWLEWIDLEGINYGTNFAVCRPVLHTRGRSRHIGFATIEIVNAEFAIVIDAGGEGALLVRGEVCGH